MATRTRLPYVLFLPGLVLIFDPNFCPGGFFKFVEKFRFFYYLSFLKAFAYFNCSENAKLRGIFYYLLTKGKCKMLRYHYSYQYTSSTADLEMYRETSARKF